jgi:hypothetical protein
MLVHVQRKLTVRKEPPFKLMIKSTIWFNRIRKQPRVQSKTPKHTGTVRRTEHEHVDILFFQVQRQTKRLLIT